MTKIIGSLSRLLWDTDLIATRFLLALAEMLWAIMLVWPGETFSRPTYLNMAALMSEGAWAIVFALSSITQRLLTTCIKREITILSMTCLTSTIIYCLMPPVLT